MASKEGIRVMSAAVYAAAVYAGSWLLVAVGFGGLFAWIAQASQARIDTKAVRRHVLQAQVDRMAREREWLDLYEKHAPRAREDAA